MGQSRVFFPQGALDQWLLESRVELGDRELVVKAAQRRFRLIEAVRILEEVTGTGDPFELVGKVKSVSFVTELGAELLGQSMIVGDNAYDVVPGFIAAPQESFLDYQAGRRVSVTDLGGEPPPGSDEELLVRYLSAELH